MNPIKTFVSKPVFTSMLIMVLVVFGLYAYPSIGVDQLPNIDVPVVTITTILAGADPETIERNVSDPIEEAVNSIAGVETLQSFSVENASRVVVRFKLERDIDIAAQDVRDKVQGVLSKLPADIRTPLVEKLELNGAPVVTLAMTGTLPVEKMTQLAEEVVKPNLQQVNGVGAVDVVGGRKREVSIIVDPVRLRAFGLTATDIRDLVRAQHIDVPAGHTTEPGLERPVRLSAEASGIDALRDLIVGNAMGPPIHLRDVAEVVDGPAEARSMARKDGQPAIGLDVRKQSGANTVEVSAGVLANLDKIRKGLPQGVSLELVNDGSSFIRKSMSSVKEDLLLGGIFAVLVVLVFLRNWRSTLISAVALPVSVIGTFAVMAALNFTFNTVTMIALTLSIGLLIDDAIVVIENIVRHMEGGEKPADAAVKGTSEISLAVLAVTMAIIAVFVPVAFMRGIVGKIFYQFGVTVVAAVAISYVVSVTLTPTFAARVLRVSHEPGTVSRTIERVLLGIESAYRRLLSWVLRRRAVTVVLTIALLCATVATATKLKFTMMGKTDNSELKVAVEMPMGSRVEDTVRQLVSISNQAAKIPGVQSTFLTAGAGTDQEVNKGEVRVKLVPMSERTYSQTAVQDYLRKTLVVEPGVTMAVSDVNALIGGGLGRTQEVQFNVRGTDWNEVQKGAEKVRQFMLSSPQFKDVDLTYRSGKPQLEVVMDRDRASALGVPAAQVGATLRALMGGDKIADYRDGSDTFEIKMKLPADVLADPDAIAALQVRTMTRQLVEVRNIGSVRPGQGPSRIERQSQLRQITLVADLRNCSLSEAMGMLNGFVSRELPAGIQADFGGSGGELGNTMSAFALALLLGIVLVYIILAMQFESLVLPLSIMMALPLAVIGAIGALLVAREYMSVFTMIGILMLMGLVTKNGILLIEFTNQLRKQGRSTLEALMEAGPIRLRPILMTTVAMIAGMIPVAIARGEGAELRNSMAIAVIGGLVTSTFLTLAVVPVAYSLLDSLTSRLSSAKRSEAPCPVRKEALT